MKPTPPKRRLQAPLAMALLALLCCLALAPAASAKTRKHPPQPLYWGAVIGKQLTGEAAPWDMGAVAALQRLAGGKPLSLISFGSPFMNCTVKPCEPYSFPTTPFESIRAYGAIPLLSWSSSTVPQSEDTLHQPAFRLSRVLAGAYDGYIREFAEAAREWGHPFFLRFNWEMNGFWFPWSEGVNGNRPGEFVKAWRHVHDIFREVGATNATWVWCPNIALIERLRRFRQNYPGHAYVDWTCLDGFNWGGHPNSAGWMSFDHFFKPAYDEIMKFARRKPMMIGEVASEERGGNKAAWIRNTLRTVPRKYKKVRALVWFNDAHGGTARWSIQSSRAASRAFAKAIRSPLYRPNEFGEIETSPIPPPSWPLLATPSLSSQPLADR